MTTAAATVDSRAYRGQQIRSRREARGLSQPDLAELVRVEYARRTETSLERVDKPTRFDIIRWEKGQAVRDLDMLAALAHVLGATVDELVRPELAMSAQEKATIAASLGPLVDVLFELVRQKVEESR